MSSRAGYTNAYGVLQKNSHFDLDFQQGNYRHTSGPSLLRLMKKLWLVIFFLTIGLLLFIRELLPDYLRQFVINNFLTNFIFTVICPHLKFVYQIWMFSNYKFSCYVLLVSLSQSPFDPLKIFIYSECFGDYFLH